MVIPLYSLTFELDSPTIRSYARWPNLAATDTLDIVISICILMMLDRDLRVLNLFLRRGGIDDEKKELSWSDGLTEDDYEFDDRSTI